MIEQKPPHKIKRKRGRPANGKFPHKIFAHVSDEQLAFLKEHYDNISHGIRSMIDFAMQSYNPPAPPDGKEE